MKNYLARWHGLLAAGRRKLSSSSTGLQNWLLLCMAPAQWDGHGVPYAFISVCRLH